MPTAPAVFGIRPGCPYGLSRLLGGRYLALENSFQLRLINSNIYRFNCQYKSRNFLEAPAILSYRGYKSFKNISFPFLVFSGNRVFLFIFRTFPAFSGLLRSEADTSFHIRAAAFRALAAPPASAGPHPPSRLPRALKRSHRRSCPVVPVRL